MPTYPTADAAAGLTATAVTTLWTFSPTDTSDDDAWIPRNGATAVINLLDILLQVTATYSTCGPDGSTGIRMVRSAGSPLLILKIDLDDVAALTANGPHVRQPGDLWFFDFAISIQGGASRVLRLVFRDANADQLGIDAIGATTLDSIAGTTRVVETHSIANIQRVGLRWADYGRADEMHQATGWVQGSTTPTQDVSDLIQVTPQIETTLVTGSVIWFRIDTGGAAGSDMTLTHMGIGVIPGVGMDPGPVSWDY